ncbi:inositol monophosphatase family protein [Metabacillus sp. HB246100]
MSTLLTEEKIVPFVEALIVEAGDKIRKRINESTSYEMKKNFADLVTAVDQDLELFLIKELQNRFPSHYYLTEETNPTQTVEKDSNDQFIWVIDPIDGTMNFVHGFNRYAISIALCKGEEIILGFILDVNNNTLYSAIKGAGAFCQGERIQVSNTSSINNSLLALGFSAEQWEQKIDVVSIMTAIAGTARGIRITGSSCLDLADVATGKLDSFFHYGLAPWDMAAGSLLVQEANGICTGMKGEPNFIKSNGILVTNGHLHHPYIELMSRHV